MPSPCVGPPPAYFKRRAPLRCDADSADWLHRLRIVGIDLRDPAQVVALAANVAAKGPLDMMITR